VAGLLALQLVDKVLKADIVMEKMCKMLNVMEVIVQVSRDWIVMLVI